MRVDHHALTGKKKLAGALLGAALVMSPALAAACVYGCSSMDSGGTGGVGGGSPAPAPPAATTPAPGGGTTMTASETWTDGRMIAQSVTIAPGAAVTIAAGATVTVAAGATITVQGTLAAASASGPHAKLTGSGWTGLVVARGGTLTLGGVDVAGATTAIHVGAGAAKAEYDDATIDGATTPFAVDVGGALGVARASVTAPGGPSKISGALTASHLDYASNGREGITTLDPSATLAIDDSTLHGTGPSGDMLVAAAGAKSVHVAHTTISNVHCAFHFDSIDAFDISTTEIQGNAWGFMLYGSSGAGPRSVTYSNVQGNSDYAYETQGNNGPITFDHCYVSGQTAAGSAVAVTNPATAVVGGTGPR
jgi:hypothetical protein